MKKVAVSGYFTWLHKGHIRLFKEAKKLGDYLIVIINNENQQVAKKGKLIMPTKDIKEVISAFRCVDEVVIAIDEDKSVCKTLDKLKPDIFANGGDRTELNTPERKICFYNGIEMVYNVGGDKVESSSNLISKANRRKK